jgi:hypothetical protein
MVDIQENALEEALRLAADSPSHRPEFYNVLLEASIYILSQPDGSSGGIRKLEVGEKVSILNWVRNDGSPVIPFFTSLHTLQKAIEAESTFMELPARALFEMTKGAVLFLNPKSPYGKEFFPNEIEALLSEGVNRLAEKRITTKETQVLLGQPAIYPAEMTESLAALFAKRSNVKTAYLALMHDPSQDEKPHLLIGIEAERDIEQIIREAGVVAGDSAPDGEPVDLIRIERQDQGLSQYFIRQVKPFYKRNWASSVKSLFGTGRT